MRLGLSLAALLIATLPATAQDTPIGVPTCDTFVTNYQACVTTRLPEAQRAVFATQVQQMRTTWRELAQTPEGRTQLELICRQQADGLRQGLQAYGCQF